jgi:pimeloyl-ACP methyl ester carboxylesterase
MHNTRSGSRWLRPLTAVAGTLLAPGFGAWMSYAVCHPPRRRERGSPAKAGLDARELWIEVTPGRRLHAWLFPGDPERVIVLGHGIGQDKSRSLPHAQFMNEAGYTVVLFDFRNHGKSFKDRGATGYNRRFTSDVVAVVNHLRAMPEYAGARIALYGLSFSTFSMLYAPTRLDGGVAGIICDCGPTQDPTLPGRMLVRSGALPLPGVLRGQPARSILEAVYGRFFRITVGAPRDWPPPAQRTGYDAEMLFIAGDEDFVMAPEQQRSIAEPYPNATVLAIPGAGHMTTMLKGHDRYVTGVLSFLERALGKPAGRGGAGGDR